MKNISQIGHEMHHLCRELFPICRSLAGPGFRQSLNMLKQILPELCVHSIPTGTTCFDWSVPKEWHIQDAYIITPAGHKICSFKQSNLHVVSYSIPINQSMSLEDLQQHLYSLPEQPDAIPYITSYYKEAWGFCITHAERETLQEGTYQVVIKSSLQDGVLNYGELVIPGESKEEIFLSSYLCHPSMANNELSGPVVATYLAKWIASLPRRRYTYRLVIVPETIGSIAYLSTCHEQLKQHVIAGFNLSCMGDDRSYSYLPSRQENTLADKAALHVLKHHHPDYHSYSYLERGSDERQYCSPGIDLPVCSVMRTKYGEYPEYHTSLDDLDLVTPSGLAGGYEVMQKVIDALEHNEILQTVLPCEPQLGKRGLYPLSSTKESGALVADQMNLLAYCDGKMDLIDIANKINRPIAKLEPIVQKLKAAKLLYTKENVF